jgi:Ca-activated chloride channel family protein
VLILGAIVAAAAVFESTARAENSEPSAPLHIAQGKSSSNIPQFEVSPVLKTTKPLSSSPAGSQSAPLQTGTSSTTLQTGTSSTTLQTGTSSTMLQTGTDSTLLKTGTDSTLLQTGTASSLIQSGIEKLAGPVNILFVLDCSYSMKDKMTGEQKMESAKQVLQMAMSRIPSDVNVGLRVFGEGGSRRAAFIPEIDCRQSALLVPLGTNNRRTIIEKVRNINPYGMTPLEYALRQAAEDDFEGVKGTKTLILISDGADTCGGNPCLFISHLPMIGIKVKVDIVGLALHGDRAAQNQLKCVAETSGGKYYDADTAAKLIESVSQSVNQAISGRVLPKGDTPVKNIETPPELQQIQPLMGH